jgi:hypothetical protein
MGERQRRRPSDGYGRAEATPSYGRLWPGHDVERLKRQAGDIRAAVSLFDIALPSSTFSLAAELGDRF